MEGRVRDDWKMVYRFFETNKKGEPERVHLWTAGLMFLNRVQRLWCNPRFEVAVIFFSL